ncbi:MAG: class II aldolase/adducin family protein [Planctomycetota bacterium]
MSIETVSIELRKQLCEIGRRMYDRQFCAANEGNLSCRLSDDEVLCTPTLHCKGFLQPDDLCTVDLQGNQLSGTRRRTSEILLHLEIYRQRPDVRAVVHCHPPPRHSVCSRPGAYSDGGSSRARGVFG